MTITTETISQITFYGDVPSKKKRRDRISEHSEYRARAQEKIRPFLCPPDPSQTRSAMSKSQGRSAEVLTKSITKIRFESFIEDNHDRKAISTREKRSLALNTENLKYGSEMKKRPLMLKAIANYENRRSSGRGTLAW